MKMHLSHLVVMTILAAILSVSCDRVHYETVPGDPLETKMCTLDNGLKIFMTVNKEAPRIQSMIAVKVGNMDDPDDNTGLAHYLEHMMLKGTERLSSLNYEAEKPLLDKIDSLYEVYRTLTDQQARLDLYRQIDSLSYESSKYAAPQEYWGVNSAIGCGANAFTGKDRTFYVQDFPSNQLENWARIQSDCFQHAVFRGFPTELEAVYEEYNMNMTSDGQRVVDTLYSLLFPNHPYGTKTVLGKPEHLKNPSIRAIREQKERYYVPDNMAICLSGDFNPDDAVRVIKQYFGSWKAAPHQERPHYKSQTITSPAQADVVGPNDEYVIMGWRIPGHIVEGGEIAEVVSSILQNNMCGIFDEGLVQNQQIGGIWTGIFNMAVDESVFNIQFRPKKGETLEQTLKKVQDATDVLRKGTFSKDLVDAAKLNWSRSNMTALESNWDRASLYVESFVGGIPLDSVIKRGDRVASLTKDDIVSWVNQYLDKDKVAIVYKRQGDNPLKKIDSPIITPIEMNDNEQSAFYKEIVEAKIKPITPVFPDFKTDMTVMDCNGLELLYKRNERNTLAKITLRYNIGKVKDPKLEILPNYLSYLGTATLSNQDLSKQLYNLACDYEFSVEDAYSELVVSGLSENISQALDIVETFFDSPQADEQILLSQKEDLLRSRESDKNSQEKLYKALRRYIQFGPDYIKQTTIDNYSVRMLTSADLFESLKTLRSSQPTLLYYGPDKENEVLSFMSRYNAENLTEYSPTYCQEQALTASKVFLVDFDSRQFNYIRSVCTGESFDISHAPGVKLFNKYYGMYSLHELRTSRGLAYVVWSQLESPSNLNEYYRFYTDMGCQNDKLRSAIIADCSLTDSLIQSQVRLDNAKKALDNGIRAKRLTGDEILTAYLNCRQLGLDSTSDKYIYDRIGQMTMDDILSTYEALIKSPHQVFGIVGKISDFDMDYLRTLGTVEVLKPEDIFGY